MTTSQRLFDVARDLWERYSRHPFVLGIRDGTLDREKFRYYVIQDYLYLLDYARCFALGLAKAPDQELRQLFSSYVRVLMDTELDIHRGYLGELAITRQELDQTPVHLDNLSYTCYMLRVAYEEGPAEILTAILPCAWSYEVIAKAMVQSNPQCPEHPFYGPWVRGYAAEDYGRENQILLKTLDQITAHYTEAQLRHLQEIFLNCSRYEGRFWDLAWEAGL